MSHTVQVDSVPITCLKRLRRAVAELVAAGTRIEIRENTVPRMYFDDQFKRDLGRKSEVADITLHLPDAAYDVALLRDEKGKAYTVHFDPYGGTIEGVLGNPVTPKMEANARKAHKQELKVKIPGKKPRTESQALEAMRAGARIGKLLSSYAKHTAIDTARAAGHQIESCKVNKHGEVQLTALVS